MPRPLFQRRCASSRRISPQRKLARNILPLVDGLTASFALGAEREKLVGLISATEQTVKGAHEAVTTLKSIGGPEILGSINALSEKLDQESKMQQGQLARLKMLLLCALVLSAIAVLVGIYALVK